ncbi:AAA family ATPase [Agrobacterium sp. CG674]
MGLIEKHTPKSAIKDFTHDPKLLLAANGYIRKTFTRPLLLFGVHGTGKTAFAKALAMGMAPDMHPTDVSFVDVSSDTSIEAVRRIDNMIGLFPVNSRSLRVIILDEVDNFSRQGMESLKGLMTKYPSTESGVFFILTTNHLQSLSAPVRDRCKAVHVPATTVEDVLPVAKSVLAGEGIELSDSTLRAALTTDTSRLCSYRQMYGVLEEIITRGTAP